MGNTTVFSATDVCYNIADNLFTTYVQIPEDIVSEVIKGLQKKW